MFQVVIILYLPMSYESVQRKRQESIRIKKAMLGDRHILNDGGENIFESIRDSVKKAKIKWWGGKQPTGSMCSSQVSCINHLFPLRDDADTVLAMLNALPKHQGRFESVQKYKEHYISFELESKYAKAEMRETRPTQIDALILAKDKVGKLWLIVMEWKYTESYGPQSEYTEERGKRYNNLISELGCFSKRADTSFYINPFHQLMRQTLWAKLHTLQNCTDKELKADEYLHLFVSPKENKALHTPNRRNKSLVNEHRLSRWGEELLADPNRFISISPQELVADFIDDQHKEYLIERYW